MLNFAIRGRVGRKIEIFHMLTKSGKPICTLPLLILAVIFSKACP